MYRAEPRTNDHSPLYSAMMNSYQDFCMVGSSALPIAQQFIAIEITIMHKIQIEWNSIRHSLSWYREPAPYLYGFFIEFGMQCTSSIVIKEEMYFPFLYVTEPSCSGAGSPVTLIITRDVSFVGSLRRGAMLRFRLYRMLVLAREAKEGGERCEEWTGSWRHLSLPERRKVTNLPFILNFTAWAKTTSVCFQKLAST